METTFKYQGKIITAPNLEKKLKRMNLTLEDIEIIPTVKKEIKIEEPEDDRIKLIIKSTQDSYSRVSFIPKDKPIPSIKELLKPYMWNPITKTGIKELTEDYLNTLYYDKI